MGKKFKPPADCLVRRFLGLATGQQFFEAEIAMNEFNPLGKFVKILKELAEQEPKIPLCQLCEAVGWLLVLMFPLAKTDPRFLGGQALVEELIARYPATIDCRVDLDVNRLLADWWPKINAALALMARRGQFKKRI